MKKAIATATVTMLVSLSVIQAAAASIPGDDTTVSQRPPGMRLGAQLVQLATSETEWVMPIGRVRDIHGDATVSRLDGNRFDGSPGLPIHQGDTIRTGVDSGLTVVFADDTELSLGEDGNFVVDRLTYDPDALTGEARFNILRGVFVFVSGNIARMASDAMTVSTPSATIGIRGSQMVGSVADGGSRHHVTLLPDAHGRVGEVVISNRSGAQVLNRPRATTWTTGDDHAPAPPAILSRRNLGTVYPGLRRLIAEPPADNQAEAVHVANDRDPSIDDAADLVDFATASGQAAEISVPMVGIPFLKRNGRHGQASIHTYLKVRGSEDAKTVCQWMPRIRDVMLATLQRHPLRQGAVGASSRGWERLLKKEINTSMKSDLIVSIRLTPYAAGVVRSGCQKDDQVRRRSNAKKGVYGVSSLPRRTQSGDHRRK